jgi:hypothetical protein
MNLNVKFIKEGKTTYNLSMRQSQSQLVVPDSKESISPVPQVIAQICCVWPKNDSKSVLRLFHPYLVASSICMIDSIACNNPHFVVLFAIHRQSSNQIIGPPTPSCINTYFVENLHILSALQSKFNVHVWKLAPAVGIIQDKRISQVDLLCDFLYFG